jgi:hypothetical protein
MNPSILNVDSGELVLRISVIARAKCYEVQWAAVGNSSIIHLPAS